MNLIVNIIVNLIVNVVVNLVVNLGTGSQAWTWWLGPGLLDQVQAWDPVPRTDFV